jgi:hypothetical protein
VALPSRATERGRFSNWESRPHRFGTRDFGADEFLRAVDTKVARREEFHWNFIDGIRFSLLVT